MRNTVDECVGSYTFRKDTDRPYTVLMIPRLSNQHYRVVLGTFHQQWKFSSSCSVCLGECSETNDVRERVVQGMGTYRCAASLQYYTN